jgi:peptide methionine sulfoxide reductase MsrA
MVSPVRNCRVASKVGKPCVPKATPSHLSEKSSHKFAFRNSLAAALLAAQVLTAQPTLASEDVTPIYFGNGCFWGRQYDFINTEKSLGRDTSKLSALVGYAGGQAKSPDGRVCYYYGPRPTQYEGLGHAEVVQVVLDGKEDEVAKSQFRKFAQTYFSQFKKTKAGMIRQDPQDAGPGYRNVVGLPGGIHSPLFPVLEEANANGMKLLAGEGNEWSSGMPKEDDLIDTVWVVDSEKLPFNKAEMYHQFHNGLGKAFPKQYTRDLKKRMVEMGKVGETGCPEYFFLQ